MITINFSPVRADVEPLTLDWDDPVLIVNGTPYDLSELGDGDTAEHDVIRRAERTGDDYIVTLRLPHGANAPQETRFPEPVVMSADQGVVPVPPYNTEEE